LISRLRNSSFNDAYFTDENGHISFTLNLSDYLSTDDNTIYNRRPMGIIFKEDETSSKKTNMISIPTGVTSDSYYVGELNSNLFSGFSKIGYAEVYFVEGIPIKIEMKNKLIKEKLEKISFSTS
jgi:hypothetical protein